MRAAVVRSFNEDLSVETVSDPACPDNGVVLEVAACGVCRSDYHGWVGKHPRIENGSILGHEYCGTVVEAGPHAMHRIGDRLIAPFILGCGSCPACQTGGIQHLRAPDCSRVRLAGSLRGIRCRSV